MGDHQTQGKPAMIEQRRAQRGMAMQVDVGLHRSADLGLGLLITGSTASPRSMRRASLPVT
jgi:hypothetical protein